MNDKDPVKPLLWASILCAACGSSSDEAPPPAVDVTAPAFVVLPDLQADPVGRAPLAARVTLASDEPAVASLIVDDGTRVFEVTPDASPRTDHVVPLLGVHPERVNTVQVRLTDASGNVSTSAPMTWVTPPLPELFPPRTVKASVPAAMEPGVTLFDSPGGQEVGYLVAVDGAGEVVWYYAGPPGIRDARRLANGHLLFLYGRHGMVEIDMLGQTVQEWWASAINVGDAPPGATLVATDSFHHEVVELPDGWEGDFLGLSSEMRRFVDYPGSYGLPPKLLPLAEVVGDVVVEFRRDGSIVRAWSLFDLLDPFRISYGSLGGFWNAVYGSSLDWSHANAVIVDPTDGDVIVSVRSLDCLIEFDPDTGELEWILGAPDGWLLPWSDFLLAGADGDPALAYTFHQHGPEITPDGTLLVFDNGNGRAIAPAPELPEAERWSRAVEFAIDEEQRTAEIVWSYGSPDDPWYASFLGDADHQPLTGNVLVCDGGKTYGGHQGYARIVEVTSDPDPQIVFELEILDLEGDPPLSWNVYRAERLPSLYPQGP